MSPVQNSDTGLQRFEFHVCCYELYFTNVLSFFVTFLVVELNKLFDRACSDRVPSHYRKAEKLLDGVGN